MTARAHSVVPAPEDDLEREKPADVKIILDCQKMLEGALQTASSRRRWNRCIYSLLTATTLISNAVIMIAPVFGRDMSTNSSLQILLASVNTLIKGLEMQFQFGSKADNLVAPVIRLEHLLVECSGLLATPSTLEEARKFLDNVKEAVKDVCVHVDYKPAEVNHCLINSDISNLLNAATMRVLAPDADIDDMLELQRILGMTKNSGQVEPAHQKAAEGCLAGMETLRLKQNKASVLAKQMAKFMHAELHPDLGELGDIDVSIAQPPPPPPPPPLPLPPP